MHTLAVDVMSGDGGAGPAVQAVCRFLTKNDDVKVILVGKKEMLSPLLANNGSSRVQIEHADDVVPMSELPSRAVRRRGTSMRRAVELVSEGRASVAVSAGNTGCLLGVSCMILRNPNGLFRPALASFLPSAGGDNFCILDLGANVECPAEMLRQFALMGTALVRSVKNIQHPRVGLLNVGEENFKGRGELRKAVELLKNDERVNFIGNVEGNNIYFGAADVVVCDGFTGNVMVKATEGVAKLISGVVTDAFKKNWLSRLSALAAMPVLSGVRDSMDPRQYNGACLLGLSGLVVKSHGNADSRSFEAALDYAARSTRKNLTEVIDGLSLFDAPSADKEAEEVYAAG